MLVVAANVWHGAQLHNRTEPARSHCRVVDCVRLRAPVSTEVGKKYFPRFDGTEMTPHITSLGDLRRR
jgi:hypothetical protein